MRLIRLRATLAAGTLAVVVVEILAEVVQVATSNPNERGHWEFPWYAKVILAPIFFVQDLKDTIKGKLKGDKKK
jgi:predicted methyltransferase